MGRNIRYWYTYRTAVAVVLAIVLTALMYGLYTQQVACDAHQNNCYVNVSVHPEDRLFSSAALRSDVVIVGIDNASVKALGRYPLPRNDYALALRNLEAAGAALVAFDVSFPDQRERSTDADFAQALAQATVPVILTYNGEDLVVRDGYVEQTSDVTNPQGVDEIPLKAFWCSDANAYDSPTTPCRTPDKNVAFGSTDFRPDSDGVVRKVPMFVQPACYATHTCSTGIINPLGFAAYRAFSLSGDVTSSTTLQESNGQATFGTAWLQPLQVDSTGSAVINYTAGPGQFQGTSQYIKFSDAYSDSFATSAVKDKIVLIGGYYLTGFHDEFLTPGGNGKPMPGVEIHANVLQMLLPSPPTFVAPEPPILLFLIMLVLAIATGVGVARVTVLWGFFGTVGALVLFTVAMSALSVSVGWVPILFQAWLAIALTYTGVTAYRFLYEDREKRKVTSLFGHYLKPEIVAQLAKDRRGVEGILRGGERRDITLMFVDIRGFTSMSESMSADDVTEVVQMYLDHLSGTIFTWDGTVDKYVGDEIVAFWNAPRLQENHALLAVRCAYDCINHGPELQQRLLDKGLPPIRWGIGINSGPAVVGNMGSRSRLQYTALGDTVNTAARFCAHAPAFHLLIGQETYQMCKDYIAVDLVPGVQLKGKSAEKFRIYQVTAIRENADSPWVQFPTELATQAHITFTTKYSEQTVIAAAETGSTDILVGEEAEELLARQAQEQTTQWPS
ncbi:MAG TPA: adenylate/guanylate cyclase domain-containing protein [Candidatus Dormibacteraeota bacterium]|nr:adenylate/guanylate cyclase domain-containing protein [Candidatus Dormibacteraeota bacterium]